MRTPGPAVQGRAPRLLPRAVASREPDLGSGPAPGSSRPRPAKVVKGGGGAGRAGPQSRPALLAGAPSSPATQSYDYSAPQTATPPSPPPAALNNTPAILEGGVRVYEQAAAAAKNGARRIVAEVTVRAPVEDVWRVLTDYESLPSFVPNLERCERLGSPGPRRHRLRQVACSQGGLWRLEAEAVLDVEEMAGPMGRREVRFSSAAATGAASDFAQLSGRWSVEPDASASATGQATVLRYDLTVAPRIPVPPAVISYVVRAGLPANVAAVARRAEEMADRRLRASGLASWAGVEEDVPLPGGGGAGGAASVSEVLRWAPALPAKGPFWPRGSPYAAAAPITAERQRRQAAREAARSAYLGTASVPLPPAGVPDAAVRRALDEQLREKTAAAALHPAFGLRRGREGMAEAAAARVAEGAGCTSSFDEAAVVSSAITAPAEVHLRRLDGLDTVHRRAVAAVTVDAPASAVWKVLTDYDRLAEFVPNLAASERIKLPPEAPTNVVRLRQVGYKRMAFMCLHAESVLDLIEKPKAGEIQFRQVAGDFERFQGKWMLAEGAADPDLAAPGYTGPQTQLKWAVEIVIPRSSRMLGVIEPVLERVVFEDAPANLAAIKRRVEALETERQAMRLEAAGEADRAASLRRRRARPRLAEMADDFGVLAAELERCYGGAKVLPSRDVLRDANRSDLEKAITAHGGPRAVAQRLGWRLQAKARKPRGYWDRLDNVRAEVDDFIAESGLPRGVMPLKNDFVRAGRFDLARAVERWGGLYELAAELGYGVASPALASTEWTDHVSEVAAETGLSGKQGLFELAAKTYASKEKHLGGNAANKGGYARMPTVREEIDAW